jgi:hypothetical protein
MNSLPEVNWHALQRLRTVFLEARPPVRDYWHSETELASYDATFAQRIGWKWDFVLDELRRRGWQPPAGEILDWGCGTGVAARAFLDHHGTHNVTRLWYWDRSALARNFAVQRARQKYPGLAVEAGISDNPAILLLSHVLGELNPEQIESLLPLVLRATATLWVEPGTYEASLTLIAIRERLRHRLHVVAPCLHRERCGILAPGNEPHWCHHFAPSPPEVHTDPFWGRFAHEMNIDLRSLPVSYLVLDQRPAPRAPAGSVRVLGRPRVYKPHALILACDASGVRDYRLTRRRLPDAFQKLKKGDWDILQVWHRDGDEIHGLQPFPDAAEAPPEGTARSESSTGGPV